MKSLQKIYWFLGVIFLLVVQTGCDDWLDKQPLSALSESSFWTTESDAMLALTGVYTNSDVGNNTPYNNENLIMSAFTDDISYKHGAVGVIYSGYLTPGDWQVVESIWYRAYATIFKANYFLENIERVDMDTEKKAEITAEVRFLRAYEYFYMSVLYGGVPLITNVLTIDEANNQSRNSLQEIVDFCITELTAAATDLPKSRPESEKGRILKAAALAVKGRLEMIDEKWSDAANTYKQIIDLNEHIIDPRYKEIFEEEGEYSKEIILSTNCVAGLQGNSANQLNYHPDFYGGYQEMNVFQNMIDTYLMNDGLPIEESPLYDPEKPFENRDPRLYASVFLPGYTVFRGKLFPADPEATQIASLRGATGYGLKKYVTENYTGSLTSSGDDIILIRYAEVLLSYLEAKLEAGENISQELLNQTINRVRGREAVNMPPVTETDPVKLREIVRRERRVELFQERLIRYMDIRRRGIFMDSLNKKFYGMKLTDDPENYQGYNVEKSGKYKGHYIAIDKTDSYTNDNALLPIPLYEININPDLEQNPGY